MALVTGKLTSLAFKSLSTVDPGHFLALWLPLSSSAHSLGKPTHFLTPDKALHHSLLPPHSSVSSELICHVPSSAKALLNPSPRRGGKPCLLQSQSAGVYPRPGFYPTLLPGDLGPGPQECKALSSFYYLEKPKRNRHICRTCPFRKDKAGQAKEGIATLLGAGMLSV